MVQQNNLKPILIIAGPTAVGKSKLALQLAKKLNTEIISADSMQVYRSFDIGTAKPSAAEMQEIQHHLIDVLHPNEPCSSFVFKQMTESVLHNFAGRGLTPLIAGGTGFYLRHLLYNFDFDDGNQTNDSVRSKLSQILANEDGKTKLYSMLLEVDSKTASTLHPNDTRRVMRALEIFHVSGRQKSQGINDSTPKYNHIIFVLDLPRSLLYERINLRVDEMMRQGLLQEVEQLVKTVPKDSQSMQGIGYKELVQYLDGLCTVNEATELIKKHTRNYAKRQLTYFRTMANTVWLDAQLPTEQLEEAIVTKYEEIPIYAEI